MVDVQLPAHLQNSKLPRIAEKSIEGMGGALPPHISIKGNRFTLIDGAGQERPIETTYLDVCLIDVSDHMCKLYFGKDYDGTNDAPLCFSANGVAPSRDAQSPQSPTCMQCPHNVRGSAVSKLTGAAIKACRDEKWLAALIPGIDIGFQFRVTPGSFKNYKSYGERFKGQNFDMRDVVTRLEFAKDANGVVTFTPTGFIDAPMATARNAQLGDKRTDVLVGRNDVPYQGLPAGQPVQVLAAPETIVTNTPRAGESAEQTAARKTRGRPRAQPAPAAAPANGPAPALAPFRTEAAPAPPFGVAASAPPPPAEVQNQVDSFFNK